MPPINLQGETKCSVFQVCSLPRLHVRCSPRRHLPMMAGTAEPVPHRLKGLYGFQCHGNAFNGVEFDQVTFVGTVEGNAKGFYEGYGTFTSDLGSVDTHIAGQATFGRNCFGRIVYTTNEIVLPGGGTIPLPPATFDFIAVDDSKEILGTGVAPGMTGDFVPRLTCRLVRIR